MRVENNRNLTTCLFSFAVHAEGQNRIHHILRNFDLDPSYGPCLGMTRLERWNRADNLGDDPPVEVYEILMSQEGRLKEEYREACQVDLRVSRPEVKTCFAAHLYETHR